METLEDLERQYRREVSFEENKKEIEDLGERRKFLKKQIRAKQFAREHPTEHNIQKGFIGGLKAVGRGLGTMAEAQRRQEARERAEMNKRSKKLGKIKNKPIRRENNLGFSIW